jgi:hypothetical protein
LSLRNLSDKDLLNNTQTLVKRERQLFTEILQHLQEIQRRRLYADLGYRSLWDYCMKALGFCESQTRRATDALKLIQEIPEVGEIIEKGEVSLSNIVQAQTHFRAEQKAGQGLGIKEKLEVIESLKNKSARDGEKILLSMATVERPPVRDAIRQVTAEISEMKFGTDDEFLSEMQAVKGLLAHKYPNLSTLELMKIVFGIARDKLDPARKERKVKKEKVPNISPPTSAVKKQASGERRHISVKINKEVWQRAESKCTNCKSEYALEIDHDTPLSLGGNSDLENLNLLCRNCNQRAAIKKLGQQTMDRYLT